MILLIIKWLNKFNTISLVFNIYRQNRLQFANLLGNFVRTISSRVSIIWCVTFEFVWPVSNRLDDLVFIVPKFPTNLAIGAAKVLWPVYNRYSRRNARENVCELDAYNPCSGHVDSSQICGPASDWTVLYLNNLWQMKLFHWLIDN
jgi:hypothetical protein